MSINRRFDPMGSGSQSHRFRVNGFDSKGDPVQGESSSDAAAEGLGSYIESTSASPAAARLTQDQPPRSRNAGIREEREFVSFTESNTSQTIENMDIDAAKYSRDSERMIEASENEHGELPAQEDLMGSESGLWEDLEDESPHQSILPSAQKQLDATVSRQKCLYPVDIPVGFFTTDDGVKHYKLLVAANVIIPKEEQKALQQGKAPHQLPGRSGGRHLTIRAVDAWANHDWHELFKNREDFAKPSVSWERNVVFNDEVIKFNGKYNKGGKVQPDIIKKYLEQEHGKRRKGEQFNAGIEIHVGNHMKHPAVPVYGYSKDGNRGFRVHEQAKSTYRIDEQVEYEDIDFLVQFKAPNSDRDDHKVSSLTNFLAPMFRVSRRKRKSVIDVADCIILGPHPRPYRPTPRQFLASNEQHAQFHKSLLPPITALVSRLSHSQVPDISSEEAVREIFQPFKDLVTAMENQELKARELLRCQKEHLGELEHKLAESEERLKHKINELEVRESNVISAEKDLKTFKEHLEHREKYAAHVTKNALQDLQELKKAQSSSRSVCQCASKEK